MNKELEANTNLSHYRIVKKIGAGGIGEVYRARDTRLDREGAIKVLPADFANDADRRKAFEQEARATSDWNQPNILTVHDIGESDDTYLMAIEYYRRRNSAPSPSAFAPDEIVRLLYPDKTTGTAISKPWRKA